VIVFIGNQTSCWAASPTEPFDYAIAQDFDAFEWFPDKKPGAGWDESDLDSRMRQLIRNSARAHGMRLSVHARWQANPLESDGHELLWKDLALALDLGAGLFNIHLIHEQGLSVFIQAILPLVRRTSEAGLRLSIENTPHHSPEQFNELFDRLRELDSVETGHVGMCLDLGHANLSSTTHNNYLGFCDRLTQQIPIIHVHLHENWGDADTHLPLFFGPSARDDSGIRGLLSRLKQRNFSGSFILEQWPHPPSLLNNARDRLLQLWKSDVHTAAQPANLEPRVPTQQEAPISSESDFVMELVAGNRRSRSWREKLEFVSGLFAREQPSLTREQLVVISIYLQFLSSGQIPCLEDGRHFRPAHHARLASEIHRHLARLRTTENEFILRKIYPWLPSSAPPFQRPEPLTRIRDIAHRNDIPSDLKREIKTRLQNKLHRCAGPEDLLTSSELFERISGPETGYPADFVEQFKIFHEELKEFFNSQSLDERLRPLTQSLDPKTADLIRMFLEQKAGNTLEDRMAAFRTLTRLRQAFAGVSAPEPASNGDELILADIALEDFAFVLLSEIINDSNKAESDAAVESQMEALTLALNNLELSGVDVVESRALGCELRAWVKLTPLGGRNDVLRLRASVMRCRRLADDFGSRIMALFSRRAEQLGAALGVPEHAIRVFSEAVIRSHIVFQVSKLADGLLRHYRQELGLAPWDILVPGRAVGRAIQLDSMTNWDGAFAGPMVVLLSSVAGDEEIPKNVAGIALAHEIPHLSHISVRARQTGVVLVACDEATEFDHQRAFEGQLISLTALPDKVVWESAADQRSAPPRRQPGVLRIPEVRLSPESSWIPLERAVPETAGNKAASARRLAELSRQPGVAFSTPPALVIPFGVMEAGLEVTPAIGTEYRDLVHRFDGMAAAESTTAARRLKELIQLLKVPDAVLTEVRRRFSPTAALIVRSSANCEDLEGFSGAGQYESVVSVAPTDVAAAILTVWSSLWTQRAAEARKAAGIPQDKCHMAVLVQELVGSDFCFVLHTVNPITQNARELYAEIAVGLGESLVSAATAASPYRLSCDKESANVVPIAFANFSQAAHANDGGGLRRETIDYSKVELSRDAGALDKLGRRLSAVGAFIERALGGPQDIEGAVVGDRIFLVQARPQQGLTREK
jgi:phosphoglucan,water dikinase